MLIKYGIFVGIQHIRVKFAMNANLLVKKFANKYEFNGKTYYDNTIWLVKLIATYHFEGKPKAFPLVISYLYKSILIFYTFLYLTTHTHIQAINKLT